jgi:anaerobic magnesium-protoporphyrin IX monomethyl ester cyclase
MKALNINKILLVHPLGYPPADAKKDIARIANLMPPLGLASIAAYLQNQNIDCSIIDCFARPDSDRLIKDNILMEKPAFIGLSCTTSSFLDGVRIAKMAKQFLPNIKAVFGGPHVSALKQKVLKDFLEIDFVVVGEGEETLAELIKNGRNVSNAIKGLIYRKTDGELEFTGYREKGIDLNTLPFPAYEKLEGFPLKYSLPIFNYPKAPSTSCISSRGCPYKCTYCDRSVFRSTYRYNSPEYLYEHLRYLKKLFGIRHINFYDDQFTLNRKRVEDFTQMMGDKPLGMTFNCAVRAEHIDRELLKQMKAAGCWMISLGIETGDENLLARHRQNADLEMLIEKAHLIKEAGIRAKGLLMMGLPGETEASIKRSMDYVFSLPLDDFNLSKFTPFPGSPLYEDIHGFGTFNEDWEKMDCMHFLFIPKGMTKEQLEQRFKQFYKTHFLRPRVLWGYVTMLWKSPCSWIRFIRNIADFIRFARTNRRKEDAFF